MSEHDRVESSLGLSNRHTIQSVQPNSVFGLRRYDFAFHGLGHCLWGAEEIWHNRNKKLLAFHTTITWESQQFKLIKFVPNDSGVQPLALTAAEGEHSIG